jgi:hypothetical protein
VNGVNARQFWLYQAYLNYDDEDKYQKQLQLQPWVGKQLDDRTNVMPFVKQSGTIPEKIAYIFEWLNCPSHTDKDSASFEPILRSLNENGTLDLEILAPIHSLPLPASFFTTAVVGRQDLTIGVEIGKGTYGVVKHASRPGDMAQYALKSLSERADNDPMGLVICYLREVL